jgi:site-specific DNA recombinase
MRVAIYTRVSSQKQVKEGLSTEAQLKNLRDYCKLKDWTIYHEYIEQGKTGRNTNRPQYKQMIAELDQYDMILVYRLDRLHRSLINSLRLLELLDSKNKHFASLSQSIDTSSCYGKVFFQISQAFAELESNIIGERITENKIYRVNNQPTYEGSSHILGYDCIGHNTFTINIEEAQTVKRIFDMYQQHPNLTSIARQLNNEGIQTKQAKTWHPSTIKTILTNPFYTGYIRYNIEHKTHTYKNTHPIIIDIEQYNLVNPQSKI